MDAMGQYVQSNAGSAVRCIELKECCFPSYAEFAGCLVQLMQSKLLEELKFDECELGEQRQGEHDRASLVQNMLSLKTLRLEDSDLLSSPVFANIVGEVLVHADSALLCLEFQGDYERGYVRGDRTEIPLPLFQTLVTAAANSTTLKHLCIDDILLENTWDNAEELLESGHFPTFLDAVSIFKVEDLSFTFTEIPTREQEEQVIDALQNNYNIQTFDCHQLREVTWDRQEVILNRNRKLALWKENPERVPFDEISYAITLALEAGSLFDSMRRALVIRLEEMRGPSIRRTAS